MTNNELLTLVGRLVVDLEASSLRIRDLEAELGRRTKHKSNVVKMQPKVAPPPDGAPAPAEAPKPPEGPVEADPVPSQ